MPPRPQLSAQLLKLFQAHLGCPGALQARPQRPARSSQLWWAALPGPHTVPTIAESTTAGNGQLGGQVILYCIYLETKTSRSRHVLSEHKAGNQSPWGLNGGAWSPPSRDTEGRAPDCAPGSRNGHVAPTGRGCVARLGDVGVTSSKAQPSTSKHGRVQNEPKQQRTNHNELMLGELRAGLPPKGEQGKAAVRGAK